MEEKNQPASARHTPRESARGSARGSARPSARGPASEEGETSNRIDPRTDCPYSARTLQDPDTYRSAMSTSRADAAISALAAQRQALENRLSIVEAALEAEGKRNFSRLRGQTGAMGKKGKNSKSKLRK